MCFCDVRRWRTRSAKSGSALTISAQLATVLPCHSRHGCWHHPRPWTTWTTRTDPQGLAERSAAAMWAADRASQGLGIRISDVSPGRATATMRITAEMVNGHGIAHGGYVFLLADTAFAFACNTYGEATVARAADIAFLAPVHEGDELVAVAAGAQPLRAQRRVRRDRAPLGRRGGGRVPRSQPRAGASARRLSGRGADPVRRLRGFRGGGLECAGSVARRCRRDRGRAGRGLAGCLRRPAAGRGDRRPRLAGRPRPVARGGRRRRRRRGTGCWSR